MAVEHMHKNEHIIHEGHTRDNGSNPLLTIVILIIFLVIFFWFLLPFLETTFFAPATPQINVPGNINVRQQK